MKKYIVIVATVIFAVLYMWSYVEVRRGHILVHTSTFSGDRDGDKLTYSHGVSPTDVLANFIYQPLMLSEVMYWYVVEPRDSIWQYAYEDSQ